MFSRRDQMAWKFDPDSEESGLIVYLAEFLSTVLRIPIAHNFRVISERKWARARTQWKKFPSTAKLDSEINVRFLLYESGDLYFLLRNNSVHIILFNLTKI